MGPTGSWLRASTTKLQTIFDEGGMKSRSQFDQGNGSRPKTHARLLDAFSIRVRSADMDVCVLLQWRKAAKARRKVCERSEYHYL